MNAGSSQAEQAPLTPEAVAKSISRETKALRLHLGLGESPGDPPSSIQPKCTPLFFVEIAPYSSRLAKCKLPTCSREIESSSYRMALHPGMSSTTFAFARNPDYYHVACFERLADMSQADFLDRVQPVTRHNYNLRGVKTMSVLDGNYLCSGGAERLVLEWKTQRGKWLDRREGVTNLLDNAGSSTYERQSLPGEAKHEYFILSVMLAPFESDGQGDTQEWNLFESYLNVYDNEQCLSNQHTLSDMLDRWRRDVFLARSKEDELSDAEKQAKEQLGEKAIRAIKRLSSRPMPDTQGAFLGRIS